MSSTGGGTRGRHRDADLTVRILDETLRLLASGGYSHLRIEQVAETVGCSKAAIYRRWKSRSELAVAALTSHMEMGEPLHSGDVTEDLTAHVWRHAQNQMAATFDENVAFGVVAVTADPKIRELFRDEFTVHRRRMGRGIIAEAVARGQLPDDVDADAMLDVFAGFVFYRGALRVIPIRIEDIHELVRSTVAEPPRHTTEVTAAAAAAEAPWV